MMRRLWCGLILAVIAGASCTNAGETLTARTLPTGFLVVAVYFDRDASHTPTINDTIVVGARVALVVPGAQDTLRVGVTDVKGQVFFDSLPVGTYQVVVDQHALPDSVGVVAPDSITVRLVNQVTSQFDSLTGGVLIRFGYAEVSLAEARAMAPGRRVLVRGKVVAPLQDFRDSSAFLVDSTGALRITGSRPRPGSNGNNIGDSVFVVGTTGQRSGQGVLQNGVFSTYSLGLGPLPQIVTVAEARNAKGGTLDAVLVQLSNVVIRDTVGSGPDFAVTVSDPADTTVTMTVLIDQLLNAPRTLFQLKHSAVFRGVLVPVGDGTWMVKPRGPFDVVVN
ncbi:MAG: hypothetical protein ACRELE_05505 [Gemmatimonadales bacterium]